MPVFTNKYLLAMLNNMVLMIGSSEIEERYEYTLKTDIFTYCSDYILFMPDEFVISLRSSYNMDIIGRNYEFLNYLISEMRFFHQRSRYIFRKFVRLLERCSYDELVAKLNHDKIIFSHIVSHNEH